jgi:hypothetical protein
MNISQIGLYSEQRHDFQSKTKKRMEKGMLDLEPKNRQASLLTLLFTLTAPENSRIQPQIKTPE